MEGLITIGGYILLAGLVVYFADQGGIRKLIQGDGEMAYKAHQIAMRMILVAILAFCGGMYGGLSINEYTKERSAAIDKVIAECEKDLPRSENCEYHVTATPVTKE